MRLPVSTTYSLGFASSDLRAASESVASLATVSLTGAGYCVSCAQALAAMARIRDSFMWIASTYFQTIWINAPARKRFR